MKTKSQTTVWDFCSSKTRAARIQSENRHAVFIKSQDMCLTFYTLTQPPWAASFGYRKQVSEKLAFVYRGLLKPPIRLLRVNRDLLAILTQTLETNNALYLGEQGVVLAAANVQTRMDLRAALTDKDVASRYGLAVRALDAQALGLGVTTVLRRAYALFMSEKL